MFASSSKVWHGLVTGGDISGPASKGIIVESVEKNSPAAEAGIKPGDVIIGLEGADMHRALDLQRALLDRKPGEKISFVLSRSGESMARRITLGSQPDLQKSPSGPVWEALGLELKPIPADEFRAVHQPRYSGGLKITAVRRTVRQPVRASGRAIYWWACTSGKRFLWIT